MLLFRKTAFFFTGNASSIFKIFNHKTDIILFFICKLLFLSYALLLTISLLIFLNYLCHLNHLFLFYFFHCHVNHECTVTRNGKMETCAEPTVLRTYVENKALLESIPFYRDQNVNKWKSRAARTVKGPIFLPFYMIIVRFLNFFCQDAN